MTSAPFRAEVVGFEPPIGDCPPDEEEQERNLRLVADVGERAWAA